MQNELVEQETEFPLPLAVRSTGWLQVVPLNVTTLPEESIAAQNAGDEQETETRLGSEGSIETGLLQSLPLNSSALPPASTATQNEVLGHETAFSR
jgi:hypothetical protein